MTGRRRPGVCTLPGCPALVDGPGRCARHRDKATRSPDIRPSSSDRGYGADWRSARKRYITANPTCEVPGCGKPATDVDHRDGAGPYGAGGNATHNLMSMCHGCHSRKTAKVDGGFGNPKHRKL
jgi:5-methylcytosine-specific restriction protein A